MPQISDWLTKLLAQVRSFLGAMSPQQRWGFLGASLAFVAGFTVFVWWASQPVFRSLFGRIGESDAAAIVEYLQTEKIPYQLELGGRSILVPAERVYDLRLALAQAGLPQGGGVGFEIFDEQKLGMTDFLQRLNYTRALQGELSRTISQIAGVSAARVHLAMPERSVFTEDDRRPSASVVLTLAPGRVLGGSTVGGIVHLIASSVEGMSPDDITVVDNGGRVLAGDENEFDGTGIGSNVLDYQRTLERNLEERIESMLGRVVGPDRVSARVSAVLNMTRVDTTEQRVDPDQTAVLNERRSREESTGQRAVGGTPGVTENLTNDTEVTTEAPRTTRRDETVSYEVSKITSRTIGATGQIDRLSVAVLVDGTFTEDAGAQSFVPRPQEELDGYTELVKSAIGYDEARGDRVEMASVPFQVPEVGELGWLDTAGDAADGLAAYVPRLLGIGIVLMLFLSFVRPALQRLATQPTFRGRDAGSIEAGGGAPDLEAMVSQLGTENRRLTAADPERAAYLVRQWLQARD
jgi:flagellar M-ring protein FliF